MLPFLISLGKGQQEVQRAADAPAITCLETPQLHTHVLPQRDELHQAVQIQHAIAEATGPFVLQWLAAIRHDLQGKALLLRLLENITRQVRPADKEREIGSLNVVKGAVIVLRLGLIQADGTLL